MQKAAAGALLLASLMSAGAAQAQSSAQVSLFDFTWALADLDPNDGIDPSLTFLAPAVEQTSTGSITIDADGVPTTGFQQGGAAFVPLAVSASSAVGNAGASISGLRGAGLALNANASLTSAGGASSLSNKLSTGYLQFVLSPMTAVTFSSRVALTLGLDTPAPLTGGSTSASARIGINSDVGGFFPESWSETVSRATSGGPESFDGTLTTTLSNALGASTTNEIQLSTTINADVMATPVPEPSTWAMFLGGLALLYGHARSRVRKAAKART